MTFKTLHLTKLSLVLVLSLVPHLFAGSEPASDSKDSKETPIVQKSSCETPDPWEIRLGLPGFISRLTGDFGVKGVVAPLDLGFDTLFHHLDAVPIALSASVRYNRWEFFADGEYIQLSDSVQLPGLLFTNADLGLDYAFWEGFVGYRLINCSKGSLTLYAGARYTYYSGDFRIDNNADPRFPVLRELLGIPESREVSGTEDWVDPVVGIGGRVQVAKAVTLYANGDVGGFDVNSGDAFKLTNQAGTPALVSTDSSDWSYQFQGGVEIQWSRSIWTQIGWRYLKYDYVIGGFVNKTDLNGPFVQAGIRF